MRGEIVQFQPHLAMQDAHRRRLFDEMVAAKRHAEQTEKFDDFERAAKAYRVYVRSYLTEPEQEVLRLEDEVAALWTMLRNVGGGHGQSA